MSSIHNMTRATRCPVCQFENGALYALDYSTFRHLDFSEQVTSEATPNMVCACAHCGVIYRVDRWEVEGLISQFTTDEYAAHQEDHQVRDQQGALRDAAEVQAGLLLQSMAPLPPQAAILDIGCFDGKLLSALKQKTEASRLTGYDVAPRSGFPSEQGFEFVQDLDGVEGEYDLIVLSHSLIYIEEVKGLFVRIDQLLKSDGQLFIHVPNADIRPSSVLLGDQLYYFGSASLEKLLECYGFSVHFIGEELFPKDLLVVASRERGGYGEARLSGGSGEKVIEALGDLENAIRSVVEDIPLVSVLGTTMEAAFVNSLIPDQVAAFVDENPSKQQRGFSGKRVVSPAKLKRGEVCLIPMGAQSKTIAERLSQQSAARFVAL